MNHRDNYFFQALSVINSLFIFVVALFMIDAIYSRSEFMHQLWLGLLVAIPLKIYCYAGIYGYLPEIVSGQQMVLTFSRFHANALRYMWFYAGVLTGLYVLNFILFILDLRLALVWAPPKMTEVDDFGLNIVFQKIDELNLTGLISISFGCSSLTFSNSISS